MGLPADIPVSFPADILQYATQWQLFPLLYDMLFFGQPILSREEDTFYFNISEEIKDRVATTNLPMSFKAKVDFAIKVDNWL